MPKTRSIHRAISRKIIMRELIKKPNAKARSAETETWRREKRALKIIEAEKAYQTRLEKAAKHQRGNRDREKNVLEAAKRREAYKNGEKK